MGRGHPVHRGHPDAGVPQLAGATQAVLHEGTADAAAKAINMYRNWPLTGITDGQQKRPLKSSETRKDDK